MQIGFVETMRGTLLHPDGVETRVEFEVHAHAASTRAFLREGRTVLRGIVRAPPWVAEASAHGELTFDLPRSLTYRLQFEAGGNRYVLSGQKHPTVWALVRSMTLMPVTLKTDAGQLLAQGHMGFRLTELGSFAASWLPFLSGQRTELDIRRRQLERSDR